MAEPKTDWGREVVHSVAELSIDTLAEGQRSLTESQRSLTESQRSLTEGQRSLTESLRGLEIRLGTLVEEFTGFRSRVETITQEWALFRARFETLVSLAKFLSRIAAGLVALLVTFSATLLYNAGRIDSELKVVTKRMDAYELRAEKFEAKLLGRFDDLQKAIEKSGAAREEKR